jgi:nucleotide-binding universal stress UspA family protein
MNDRGRERVVPSKAAGRAPEPLLSVLVPVDLSPISDRILARVALLSLAADATVTVLHVVPAGLPVRDEQSAVRDAKKALAAEVRHLARSLARSVSVIPVVAIGTPAAEIAARADTVGAELIVMGRGGRRSLREMFLGSTAERVLRRTRAPVLVVQRPARGIYSQLAVALELDDAAPAVLGMLLRLVQRPRPQVMLIHAFVDLYGGMVYSSLTADEIAERKQELHVHASERLEKLLAHSLVRAKLPAEYSPVWKTHIRYGAPRTIIEKAVKKAERDLLVMGSHGYSGLAQLFLGTVAGDVLREVRCDVLVVPPPRPRR